VAKQLKPFFLLIYYKYDITVDVMLLSTISGWWNWVSYCQYDERIIHPTCIWSHSIEWVLSVPLLKHSLQDCLASSIAMAFA